MKSTINLKITNNTPFELPTSILGVVSNQNAFNNINYVYEFDMSAEVLKLTFKYVYKTQDNPSNVTIQIFVFSETIEDYVEALNLLNIGLFSYSGNTIYMFSNFYIGVVIAI
jgi:hypothetical protein